MEIDMLSLPTRRTGRRLSLRWSHLGLESLERRELPSANPLGAAYPNVQPRFMAGLTPSQVRHAYGFDGISFSANHQTVAADGAGETIAIVDAFDDPNALSDLQTFDRNYGLPAPPSFVKAMPEGQPAVDGGWSGEIALDVEWAHAIAPKANLLLVEARSNGFGDLLNAVDYARHQPGVATVSMSWGGGEFSSETYFDRFFTTPAGHGGVTFVASSGDNGAWYGPEWPAVSPNVLSVGGTTLKLNAQFGYQGESGWSGSGGGFSSYESEPAFQRSVQATGIRTTPDVSYDADPNSGFSVYDSVPDSSGHAGWFVVGGTSAGAPQWAALIALADQGRALAGKGSLTNAQALVYGLSGGDFHDIISGYNGCSARPGYDLVTGRGSPLADRVIRDLLGSASSARTNIVASAGSTSGSQGAHSNSLDGDASTWDGATILAATISSASANLPITASPRSASSTPASNADAFFILSFGNPVDGASVGSPTGTDWTFGSTTSAPEDSAIDLGDLGDSSAF